MKKVLLTNPGNLSKRLAEARVINDCKERELQLAALYDERDALFQQWVPLLQKISSKFYRMNPLQSFDDLFQAGAIGLTRAIEGYDPDRCVSEKTYYYTSIANEVRRETLNNCRLIRAPECSVTKAAKNHQRKAFTRTNTVASLSNPKNTGPRNFAETVAAKRESNQLEFDERELIAQSLKCLCKDDRRIIEMRYFKNMTLEEVGAAIGVGKERVRQKEQRALKRLKKQLNPVFEKVMTDG